MANTNVKDRGVIKILLLFDDGQRASFKRYLKSPYFNSNQLQLDLYLKIIKAGKSGKIDQLTLATLAKDMSIAVSTLEKSFSHLMDHVRKFVEVELLKADENRSFGKLLSALAEMGLSEVEHGKECRKYAKKLEKLPESSQRWLQELELNHSQLKVQTNSPRKGELHLFSTILKNLDQYYFVTKMKYACSQLNVWRIYGGTVPPKMESLLPAGVSASLAAFSPLCQAYFLLGSLLQKEGESQSDFETTFTYLNTHIDQFSWEDQIDLYGYLLNSCFRLVSQGRKSYIQQVDLIYQKMLDQELLVVQGTFNSGHFKNIVSIRVLLGKTTEAAQFIDSYEEYLDAAERPLVVQYTRGVVAFKTGKYRVAIGLFKKVIESSPEDVFWSLESRNMLWKSYFEAYSILTMEEHDEMQRHYHAFRQYLARTQKLSDYHKATYQNFLKLFHKMVNLAYETVPAPSPAVWKQFEETVNAQNTVTNKKWLIEKINTFL